MRAPVIECRFARGSLHLVASKHLIEHRIVHRVLDENDFIDHTMEVHSVAQRPASDVDVGAVIEPAIKRRGGLLFAINEE